MYAAFALLAGFLVVTYLVTLTWGELDKSRPFRYGALFVLGPHLLYSLWQLARRRDNAGQIPRLGNWLYVLGRWSALPVTLFFAYHWTGLSQGTVAHLREPVLEVPGSIVYAVGLVATTFYLGWASFSAWIDLGATGRALAAQLAFCQALLTMIAGTAAIWRLTHDR